MDPGSLRACAELRRDGAVVSVACSLNLRDAMTLSGWIVRASSRTDGGRSSSGRPMRLLTAGSGRQDRLGRLDDGAALVVAALAWFGVMIAIGRAPRTAVRRRSWWQPVGLFVAGALVDAALAPSGALVAPTLVAVARLHRVEPRSVASRSPPPGSRRSPRVARGRVRRRGCAGSRRRCLRPRCGTRRAVPAGRSRPAAGAARGLGVLGGVFDALYSPRARTRGSLGGRTSGPRCGYRSRRRPRAPGSPWGS